MVDVDMVDTYGFGGVFFFGGWEREVGCVFGDVDSFW